MGATAVYANLRSEVFSFPESDHEQAHAAAILDPHGEGIDGQTADHSSPDVVLGLRGDRQVVVRQGQARSDALGAPLEGLSQQRHGQLVEEELCAQAPPLLVGQVLGVQVASAHVGHHEREVLRVAIHEVATCPTDTTR